MSFVCAACCAACSCSTSICLIVLHFTTIHLVDILRMHTRTYCIIHIKWSLNIVCILFATFFFLFCFRKAPCKLCTFDNIKWKKKSLAKKKKDLKKNIHKNSFCIYRCLWVDEAIQRIFWSLAQHWALLLWLPAHPLFQP